MLIYSAGQELIMMNQQWNTKSNKQTVYCANSISHFPFRFKAALLGWGTRECFSFRKKKKVFQYPTPDMYGYHDIILRHFNVES